MNPDTHEARRYRLVQAFLVLGSTLVSIGCILLVYVAIAEAGEYGPGRPFEEPELAALAQAEAYWGQQPAFCTSRTLEVVAPGALGVDEQGRDVGGRATQPEVSTPCGMWIEEDELGRGLCSLVRHEYGHWLGFGHEDPELAQMPACEEPSAYTPPDERVIARRQAWDEWRESQIICFGANPGAKRQKCFRSLRRKADRIRRHFAA